MATPARRTRNDLTAEVVRQLLAYNPETGVFTWRFQKDKSLQWNGKYAGRPAGSPGYKGYIRIRIQKKGYLAHRLAWLWMTGSWPAEEIDHRGLNTADNRFSELREASHAGNNQNKPISRKNRIGIKGVGFDRQTGKFRVKIGFQNKTVHIGRFDKIDDAAAAYRRAAERFHGEFARFG